MIEAKELDGELWIKASDHYQAVKVAIEHEREAWVKVCDEMYYAFQVKRKIETKLDEEKV
jgi:hypothetical protein